MPFPLIFIGIGLLLAGGAAGKGAEAVGDSKARDAKNLQEETEASLKQRGAEYLNFHQRYISRMITYAAIIRTAVNQVPGLIKSNDVPPAIAAFIDRVCAPWGGYFAVKSSSQIFDFSQNESRSVRSAYLGTRAMTGGNAAAGGTAAAAVWAFTYVQRGVSYAMDASENLARVQAWANESQAAMDAQIEEIRVEFDDLERDFDETITPHLHRALSPPMNLADLGALAGMAELIESIALKKQSQLAAVMENMPDE